MRRHAGWRGGSPGHNPGSGRASPRSKRSRGAPPTRRPDAPRSPPVPSATAALGPLGASLDVGSSGSVTSHEASVSHPKMIYVPTMINGGGAEARTAGKVDVLAVADALEARSDDVALAMHELAQLLVAEEGVESTLQRISDLAARVIPD